MYKMLSIAALMALLLSACLVAPAGHRSARVIAPPLPVIVELDAEPYYYQSGYYYFYDHNRWRYSDQRSGPWADLPRNRYPKETKFKSHDNRRDKDRKDDRGRNDRRDRDRDDDRH